ncbi:MAG: hypothetical protein ACIAQZ_07735 [Sedimentisphaeraceae bacterium JB056]
MNNKLRDKIRYEYLYEDEEIINIILVTMCENAYIKKGMATYFILTDENVCFYLKKGLLGSTDVFVRCDITDINSITIHNKHICHKIKIKLSDDEIEFDLYKTGWKLEEIIEQLISLRESGVKIYHEESYPIKAIAAISIFCIITVVIISAILPSNSESNSKEQTNNSTQVIEEKEFIKRLDRAGASNRVIRYFRDNKTLLDINSKSYDFFIKSAKRGNIYDEQKVKVIFNGDIIFTYVLQFRGSLGIVFLDSYYGEFLDYVYDEKQISNYPEIPEFEIAHGLFLGTGQIDLDIVIPSLQKSMSAKEIKNIASSLLELTEADIVCLYNSKAAQEKAMNGSGNYSWGYFGRFTNGKYNDVF